MAPHRAYLAILSLLLLNQVKSQSGYGCYLKTCDQPGQVRIDAKLNPTTGAFLGGCHCACPPDMADPASPSYCAPPKVVNYNIVTLMGDCSCSCPPETNTNCVAPSTYDPNTCSCTNPCPGNQVNLNGACACPTHINGAYLPSCDLPSVRDPLTCDCIMAATTTMPVPTMPIPITTATTAPILPAGPQAVTCEDMGDCGCPMGTQGTCTINCDSLINHGGFDACKNGKIQCNNDGFDCIVNCNGLNSCAGAAEIVGPVGGQLTIHCVGDESCEGLMKMNGEFSNDMVVNCEGSQSCKGTVTMQFGSGHNTLKCMGTPSSCTGMHGKIPSNALSFQCIGPLCPPSAPNFGQSVPPSQPIATAPAPPSASVTAAAPAPSAPAPSASTTAAPVPTAPALYTYIGCYNEAPLNQGPTVIPRALNDGPHAWVPDIESCSDACSTFIFFGLQYDGYCTCGNDYNSAVRYTVSSDCPPNKMGAIWANDVFVHHHLLTTTTTTAPPHNTPITTQSAPATPSTPIQTAPQYPAPNPIHSVPQPPAPSPVQIAPQYPAPNPIQTPQTPQYQPVMPAVVNCQDVGDCGCPPGTHGPCTINCEVGTDACKDGKIQCNNDGFGCIVNCQTKSACSGAAEIFAPVGGSLSVNCVGSQSCEGSVKMHGEFVNDMTILCQGGTACKGGVYINFGPGINVLKCMGAPDSCLGIGGHVPFDAVSFTCIGPNCPPEAASNFIVSVVVNCQIEGNCECPLGTQEPCTINCDVGNEACKDGIIKCNNHGFGCTVNCLSGSACSGSTKIIGPVGGDLNVNCIGEQSCEGSVDINGQNANDMAVRCEGAQACKGSVTMKFGAGHNTLGCVGAPDSCQGMYDWSFTIPSNALSFTCSGTYCPAGAPANFDKTKQTVPF